MSSDLEFKAPEQGSLQDQLRVSTIRLQLAQALTSLNRKAFDAMRSHGIDWTQLPEYLDTTLIDEGNKLSPERGASKLMDWMHQVEKALDVQVRRKNMRAQAREDLLAGSQPDQPATIQTTTSAPAQGTVIQFRRPSPTKED